MYSQGFSIYRLQNLIRLGGKGGQVLELEDLYMNMLKKLESLAIKCLRVLMCVLRRWVYFLLWKLWLSLLHFLFPSFEFEDLYMNMLKMLKGLAKNVCKSSDMLFEKVGISSSNCGLVCCTFFPSLYLLFINVVAYCLHCVKAPKLTDIFWDERKDLLKFFEFIKPWESEAMTVISRCIKEVWQWVCNA